MAVIIKYVVERNGEEKMTFTSKKDADNYDKMLDVADQFLLMLKHAEPEISEQHAEKLSFFLATQSKLVQGLLKGHEFDPSNVEKESL